MKKILKRFLIAIINHFVPGKIIRVHSIYKKNAVETKARHEKKLTETKATYEKRVVEIQTEHKNNVTEIKLAHVKELSETKAKLESVATSIQKDLDRQLSENIGVQILPLASRRGKAEAKSEIVRRYGICKMRKFSAEYHLGMKLSEFRKEGSRLFGYYEEFHNTLLFNPYFRASIFSNQLLESQYPIFLKYIEEKKDFPLLSSFYSLLLYRGELEKLDQVYNQYGLQGQEAGCFPALSNWLIKTGRVQSISIALEKAATLFMMVKRNSVEIEELVKGKTIAIVGNAASEIGLGRGSEIDSHDIVLRFNEFEHRENLNVDYGSKVDIWITAFQAKSPLVPVQAIVPTVNFHVHPISLSSVSALHKYLIWHSPRVLDIQQGSYMDELKESADVLFPSSGLQIVALLNRCAEAKTVSLFGFDMEGQETKWQDRHYQDQRTELFKGTWHCWDQELEYFQQQGWRT